MRRSLLLFMGLMVSVMALTSCGQGHRDGSKSAGDDTTATRSDTGRAAITFTEVSHDFGRLTEGEVVSHTFHFTNTGTADLLITSVSASCGCTVPKYSKKPVPPGGKGTIEVEFNTLGKSGHQQKSIAVRGNTYPPVTILLITAEVEPAEKN